MKLPLSVYNYSLALIVCFIAGLIAVFAFEPFAQAWLIFPALAVLFYYWSQSSSPKQAFILGLVFGYGLFGLGVSWVYVSLSTYGGMPLWMGGIAVFGFVGLLAIFIGLAGYVLVKLSPAKGFERLILLAPIWVIFEWLKGWVLTGFPWLEIGYTQTTTWLFALAPIGGVYLISFIIVILSCLLSAIVLKPRFWLYPASFIGLIILLIPLTKLDWSDDTGAPINVGLVQTNIPIESKWQAGQRDEIITRFRTMSEQMHASSNIDLFIWPETALPLLLQQTDTDFWNSITPSGTALLTGLMDNPSNNEFYNSAVLSCAGQQQIYRKRHLVPFGEYLPLRFLFDWVLDYLQLPMSDLSAWSGKQSLQCPDKNINLGLSICYEDAFSAEWRRHIGDASLLVNISEDAWFGDSFAPHQRLQMAQMRAREFSRPLVRSANTGPSVVIDQLGKVQASTEQFVVQSLSYSVQPQTGETWYKRFGNWVVILSFCIISIIVLRDSLSNKRA